MLSDKIKELEDENERAHRLIEAQYKEIIKLRKIVESYKRANSMIIPNKVYTHKARKNTTVKFLDGSQQTVKRKAGEKDCIETAIAYCILKQVLTASDLKKLIENREEH